MFELLSDLGRRAAVALAGVAEASPGVVPAELGVARSGKPEFGDLQISACMQLSKPLKRSPLELANLVAESLKDHAALQHVEAVKPGFVNIKLRDEWIAERVTARLDDPQLGLRPIGAGQRIVLDYSSPNMAKPMHIGHIRTTIIGDALARSLRALGYDVIADNHVGDWGTQFGKLLVAYRRWVDPAAYERDATAELERIYVQFTVEERRELAALGAAAKEAGDEEEAVAEAVAAPILVEARRELAKLQAGDAENRTLWRKFIDDSRHVFETSYARLGVRFDYWLGESDYNQMLPTVVAELLRRNIAKESRGALVVEFDPSEKLGETPFIVRKRDGAYNYGTTDLAAIVLRVGLFNPSRIIVVTDERQQLHFRQLYNVARKLGVTIPLEHAWFGLMRLAEGTFSTRDGNVIPLTLMLDEAERRAREQAVEVAEKRGATFTDEELREIGRVVGLGAVKYNDLSKDRQTLVTFTWDKALALNGNSAPYLQYGYARIRSIIAKAGGAAVAKAEVKLTSPLERNLALALLAYPDAVEQLARTARPHVLCDHLYSLSNAFASFYADENHKVIDAEPALRASRLVLCELVSRTVKHGLGLLGIEVVERM